MEVALPVGSKFSAVLTWSQTNSQLPGGGKKVPGFFSKTSMYRYKAIKVNGKKIDEHRYIMQKHLGRKLSFNEIVHHKNNNPRDNRIDNLEVISRGNHVLLHQANGDVHKYSKEEGLRGGLVIKNKYGIKVNIYRNGQLFDTADSLGEASKKTGYSLSGVSKAFNRKSGALREFTIKRRN